MYVYHVVTDRTMYVGQEIVFDKEHHSGVYQRVQEKIDIVDAIYADPTRYNADELEHHTAVALRELALEEIRQEKYPQYPSRMSFLYVSKTFEEADNWGNFFAQIGRPTYSIVKLKINGNCFIGDATKCFKGTTDKEENLRLAEIYWENKADISNERPIYEMLVDGHITVVEIVKEINANILVTKDKLNETYLINGIKQEEIDFPKRFASYEEKEYGILFYMADNKDSYDGNHACIYPDRITDLGAVLDDITEFYNRLGIKASIYHPFEKDYFRNNLETLIAHGYTYTAEDDHRVMLLTAENSIVAPKRLDIRVLNSWDECVATDILIPSGEPWEIEVTKKRTEQDGAYLFVGYLDGKAVVYSDIHKSEHGNTRFDYIVTAKEHRGNGYASEMLSFMVEYCKENEFPVCWQWAGPSEHICYRAGFREAFTMEAGFASKV